MNFVWDDMFNVCYKGNLAIMRKALGFALLLTSLFVLGCAEDKPDPREQPGFIDTTDPSKVMALPTDPNEGLDEGGAAGDGSGGPPSN